MTTNYSRFKEGCRIGISGVTKYLTTFNTSLNIGDGGVLRDSSDDCLDGFSVNLSKE